MRAIPIARPMPQKTQYSLDMKGRDQRFAAGSLAYQRHELQRLRGSLWWARGVAEVVATEALRTAFGPSLVRPHHCRGGSTCVALNSRLHRCACCPAAAFFLARTVAGLDCFFIDGKMFAIKVRTITSCLPGDLTSCEAGRRQIGSMRRTPPRIV